MKTEIMDQLPTSNSLKETGFEGPVSIGWVLLTAETYEVLIR